MSLSGMYFLLFAICMVSEFLCIGLPIVLLFYRVRCCGIQKVYCVLIACCSVLLHNKNNMREILCGTFDINTGSGIKNIYERSFVMS